MNVFDWFNSLTAQALVSVRAAASVVAVILVIWLPSRGSGYTMVKVIGAIIVGALILVGVWGGPEGIRQSIQPILPA